MNIPYFQRRSQPPQLQLSGIYKVLGILVLALLATQWVWWLLETLGKTGAMLLTIVIGAICMIYQSPWKPWLVPRLVTRFDANQRTLFREYWLGHKRIHCSKPLPVANYAFIYADHDFNHVRAENPIPPHTGKIILFSYQKPALTLCRLTGSHQELLDLLAELAELLALPSKDYSALI
ncbi:hypothetical protein [Chitinibacter sp. S2-10]|uniref:hypothetical protein n=1 Tax=Chitinibacter sp. S2-10 TaxID=3373597 RepID=UPI003977CB34